MAKKPTRPVSAAQPVAEVAAPAQPVAEQVQETQETPPVSEAPVSLIHHVSFESDKATAYSIALSIARNRKLAVVLRDETGNEMRIDAPSAKAPRAQPIAVDTGERPATLMEAGSLSKIALAPV